MKRACVLVLAVLIISWAVAVHMNAAETVQAANTVTVSVTAKEKIVLTMADVTINFGAVDPGTTTTSPTAVGANVRSNKSWDLTYTASGMDPDAGMPLGQLKWGSQSNGSDATSFTESGTFLSNQPKAPSNAGQDITHYYTLEVPWTADPGAYSASVTYSASFH